MRISIAVLAFACLFAKLPAQEVAVPTQEADDDDGEDDAAQIANQVAPDEASVPSGPQPAAPVVAAMPGAVSLPIPLDRFGQKDKPAVASTKPVNMAASLNRFGKKEEGKKVEAKKQEKIVKATKVILRPTKEAQVEADATNAKIAAESAKHAAKVADKVATHSLKVTKNAKSALKDAQHALHAARVNTAHLSEGQKKSLEEAENKLKDATAGHRARQAAKAKALQEEENKKRLAMKEKMQKIKMEQAKKKDGELDAMRKEIEALRKELKDKDDDKADDDSLLKELQDEIARMEAEEKKEGKKDQKSHDEMKSEVERLRNQIESMENRKVEVAEPAKPAEPPAAPKEVVEEKEVEKMDVKMKPLAPSEPEENNDQEVAPVESKGIDIDTAMPYGDLEPFGREDTAQELTESSIQQSDEMVDQLERAEVAEEKRSVFRALTRLRGAAITSFDGVARSQTGNIDEYNKIHKWRNTHPLHHLADEESDISKWAFPDNAD